MLNRAVVIVRPKQPYLDWALSLDDSGLVPDPGNEQTVYTSSCRNSVWTTRLQLLVYDPLGA